MIDNDSIKNAHLHQPMVVGVQTARIRLIDFDHWQKVLVRHQYLVFVVQNAGQVDSSARTWKDE